MKNLLYLILKAFFVLKILIFLNFLSWLIGEKNIKSHVEKTAWLEM